MIKDGVYVGNNYMISAAKYPFKGYWETNKRCKTLLGAFVAIISLKAKGFEIVDLNCRNIKK